MDTNEVILLQTLDYFRKKIEVLEGESYRADELDFCYNSLHADYIKKCAEYNALKTSYDKLAEDYDDLSADLHQSASDYKEKIKDLETELILDRKNIEVLIEESKDWKDKCEYYSDKIIEMQEREEDKKIKEEINNNYISSLEKEVTKLKKEIESLKNQINFEKEYETTWGQVDEAKIADIVYGDLNKATTPISSEEVDILAHMAGWEKAGY